MCKACVDAVKEIFPNVPEEEIHDFLTACTCFGFGSLEEVKKNLLALRTITDNYHECYYIADNLVEEVNEVGRNAIEKLKKMDVIPDFGTRKRKPIGKVIATVEFPLYEGDKTEGDFSWFEYREPGISGQLGTCVRQCTTIKAQVVLD